MSSNGSTIQELDKKIIRIKATFSYFENIAPLLILPFLLLWFLHYYYYFPSSLLHLFLSGLERSHKKRGRT
jgi:di/tricarboxylate transporter